MGAQLQRSTEVKTNLQPISQARNHTRFFLGAKRTTQYAVQPPATVPEPAAVTVVPAPVRPLDARVEPARFQVGSLMHSCGTVRLCRLAVNVFCNLRLHFVGRGKPNEVRKGN